jgi:TniQ
MRKASSRLLPVRLRPFADELLSSWLCRHAAFYAVPPLVMLRHCLPEVPSLRATDLDLSADQAVRLANIFSIELAAVRSMALTKVGQSSRRLIGAKPLQSCLNCCPGHMDFRPILRSQLLGWRITCPLCGGLLRDERGREVTSPFRQYLQVALRGERLLDAEAERGRWTWASPVDIARLLLMRRIPRPLPREDELWRFRVLGAIIPELDALVAGERGSLPTSGNPILPLHLRAALLAGVAIVEHAGPEMLRMLHSHTMGANRARFADLAERMIGHARRPRAISQMQLI